MVWVAKCDNSIHGGDCKAAYGIRNEDCSYGREVSAVNRAVKGQ